MTDTTLPAAQRTGQGSVSATRTGTRTYEGRNEDGTSVLVGPAGTPGHFTPGELLKIALAACTGMSSDRVIARRLGDDFEYVVWAHGSADPEEDRYLTVDQEMLLDLDALSEAEREQLAGIIAKAVHRSCTIARSVGGSIELTKTMNGDTI